MRPPTAPMPIADSQREVLVRLTRSRVAPHRQVQRARVLLLAADGTANTQIAGTVGVSPATVKSWRERFQQEGLKDLGVVRAGRGRKRQISDKNAHLPGARANGGSSHAVNQARGPRTAHLRPRMSPDLTNAQVIVVSVLREDPDLAAGLPRAEADAASRRAGARVISLPKGEFYASEKLAVKTGGLGMLLLEGLLFRGVSVAERPSLELFGPGDVVRPFDEEPDLGPTVPVYQRWWALTPARLAVLDASFTRRMSEYPEVIGELAARLARRSTAGGLRLSLVQQPRLSMRVHLMLGHLADRFGRVHPDGVTLPVPLCHGLLAWLVGASRPAVCRAANELEGAGLVAHRPDGTWWLDSQSLEDLALTTGALPVAA